MKGLKSLSSTGGLVIIRISWSLILHPSFDDILLDGILVISFLSIDSNTKRIRECVPPSGFFDRDIVIRHELWTDRDSQ
jgi:hypothetical protein